LCDLSPVSKLHPTRMGCGASAAAKPGKAASDVTAPEPAKDDAAEPAKDEVVQVEEPISPGTGKRAFREAHPDLKVQTSFEPTTAVAQPVLAGPAPPEPIIPEGPPKKKVQGTTEESFQITLSEADKEMGRALQESIDFLSDDIFGLPFSVSVAVPFIKDTPLVGISSGFTKLTGYTTEEIVGRNCRFMLQGVPKEDISEEVRQSARRYCRAAHLRNLTTMSHNFLLQRNARKNGELFWNLFMLSLVPGPNKRNYIVALQLDLGGDLDLPADKSRQAAIEPHRENLLLVQSLMFRKKIPEPMSPALEQVAARRSQASNDKEVGEEVQSLKQDFRMIGEKIKEWLTVAEESSSAFQEWGTLPLVAWPSSGLFALTDGGVALLRLDADEKPRGAMAMSIFPVRRKGREVSFRMTINEICDQWPTNAAAGGRLPSVGFTDVTPAAMDEMGGLPKALEFTAKSLCMRGDGRLFRRSQDSNYTGDPNADDPHPTDEIQSSSGPTSAKFSYTITAGAGLECVWGPGYISVSLDGSSESMGDNEVFCVKDSEELGVSIGAPPPKTPLFAIIDCCYAACKVTLMQ